MLLGTLRLLDQTEFLSVAFEFKRMFPDGCRVLFSETWYY